MQHQIFKDQCDNCKQMKVCRGYKGKVLCDECIDEEQAKLIIISATYPNRDDRQNFEWKYAQEQLKKKEVLYEQTIFDFET